MAGIIIGAVVGVVAIAIIAYFIARAMKGSLKLLLNQKSVSSGQKITGNLTVMVKKSILCDRLYIGLVGEREEISRTRSSNGGSSTQRRWIEFYRDEADVLMDEQLSAGFQETYQFELATPSEAQVMTGAGAAMRAAETMDDGAAKTIVTGIASAASAMGNVMGGRKRWKVITRLETKGVDLADSEKIHVSLKAAV